MPGEQFLETEIAFWEKTAFEEVVILPLLSAGPIRALPEGVSLSTALTFRRPAIIRALSALFSRYFFRESVQLMRDRKMSLKALLNALRLTAGLVECTRNLVRWLEKNPSITIVYSYWNSFSSYAACVAKRKGLVRAVVSRAHRYDAYEEIQPANYMPLKRQFVEDFDAVYVLSRELESYMVRQYALPEKTARVAPLGVLIPAGVSEPTSAGEVHMVSVAFCVPVKRIDKVILGLELFASQSPKLQIRWTHIGDGPLQHHLESLASSTLGPKDNVRFEFMGAIPNELVRRFYLEEQVDFFINTSESEGMPVSIMEAMAAGVPAIAPDVGGVSDLVSNDCGFLLPPIRDLADLARAMESASRQAKLPQIRFAAKKKVTASFSGATNYPQFVRELELLQTQSSGG
jgi:glycosyltransferase involved in cell wall biosynthesis